MGTRPGGSSRPGGASSRGRAPRTRRPAAAPVPAGGGGSRFTTRAVVLVAIVLLLITSYSASLRTWWQQRQDIRAVETEITRREAAIAKLEDDAQRFDDPAYIERQARERFGWVFPGEVGYRVIGADGEVEGNAPQLAEPPSEADPPWYDTLGRSVEAAGAEPVKPEPAPTTPAQPLEPSQ